MPDFSFERRILSRHPNAIVAGIDEAGRGPWAGPVVAAAVVFDLDAAPKQICARLDDSKKLSPAVRERLFDELTRSDSVSSGVGIADVEEIDRHNILQATYLAMHRAVTNCPRAIDHALVDGNRAPKLPCAVDTIVKGDGLSLSIAAASVIAKVTRDRMMKALAAQFPGYGWETNAGYGTAQHQSALAVRGVTPHHRRSFAPIRALLESGA
ncbi:MAG: ribonuclease HII [Rhodobacteraceae bacterium]|nr:ribonuclease HII [Paracoccaceae bacterium]